MSSSDSVTGPVQPPVPVRLQLYIVGLISVAGVIWWFAVDAVPWTAWPQFVLFFILIATAYAYPVVDPRGVFISPAPVLSLVLVSVFGPAAGFIVSSTAAAVGIAFSRGWVPWYVVSNAAQVGMNIAAAGVAFHLAGGNLFGNDPLRQLVFPIYIAELVRRLTNELLVGLYFAQRDGPAVLKETASDMLRAPLRSLLEFPQAVVLIVLYAQVHPVLIMLFFLILPVERRINSEALTRQEAYGQVVESLVRALDAGLPRQEGHSREVADLATAIGRQLRLGPMMLEALEQAGLMHDVGLIGLEGLEVDAADVDAFGQYYAHSRMSASVISELPRRDVERIVLYHHERYDGRGFPYGYRSRQIPLGARILAIAEAYSSMRRGVFPYTTAVSHTDAVRAIREETGRAFDPTVVRAFLAAVGEEDLSAANTEEVAPA